MQNEDNTGKEVTDERGGLPSASNMQRIAHCAGFLQAIKDLPPSKSTHDSEIGELIHLYAEVNGGIEIESGAEWVAEKVIEMREALSLQVFGERVPKIRKEERYWLTKSGARVFSGRADDVRYHKETGTILITDFKGLMGLHDPADANWQLLALAVCVHEAFNSSFTVNEILVALIQPMRSTELVAPVRYGIDELAGARSEVLRLLRRAQLPDAPRTPGHHCKFCPALGNCMEGQSVQFIIAAKMELTTTDDIAGKVALMDGAQLAIIKDRLPEIAAAMKAVNDEIKARLKKDPAAVPGYKLKAGNNVREIIDVNKTVPAMRNYASLEDILRICKLPLGKLTDLVVPLLAAKLGITKKEAGEKIDKFLADKGHVKFNQQDDRIEKEEAA